MKKTTQSLLIYFILTVSSIMTCPEDQDLLESIIQIENESGLEDILKNNQGPIAIYLYSNGCPWCTKMKPVIQKLSENKSFCHVSFYQVNGPEQNAATLVKHYIDQKVPGYPFIIFMNHGKYIDKQIGGTSREAMIKKLQLLLK